MKCKCGATLGQKNTAGEPILRTRGVVFKADCIVFICPSCKEDVPMSGDMAKALSVRLLLLLPTKRVA